MMNSNSNKWKMHWGLKVIFIPLAIAAGVFIFGTVVMKLWNFVMPAVFTGLGVITFWQAIAILILAKILFGGFKGKGNWGGHKCCCGHSGGMHGWKGKWMNMSDDEKEKMKEEWKKRCGRTSEEQA